MTTQTLAPGDTVVDQWGNQGTVSLVGKGVLRINLPSGEEVHRRRWQVEPRRCDACGSSADVEEADGLPLCALDRDVAGAGEVA